MSFGANLHTGVGMKSILVVEDDPSIRGFLSLALGMSGYEVREACNGDDALTVLTGWRPDAILLDFDMPVMDGLAFCRAQQERPDVVDVPVALMSGHHPMLLEGVGEYLQKPFTVSALLAALDSAIGRQKIGVMVAGMA